VSTTGGIEVCERASIYGVGMEVWKACRHVGVEVMCLWIAGFRGSLRLKFSASKHLSVMSWASYSIRSS